MAFENEFAAMNDGVANPFRPPVHTSEMSNGVSVERKRNPAWWLLFPMSALCVMSGLGATLSRIGELRLSGPVFYNFLIGCLILSFGVVGILLSLTQFTALNRWLTFFWGVMAAKIFLISLFFEQPQSPFEFLVFTALVALVLSVSMLAFMTNPAPRTLTKRDR